MDLLGRGNRIESKGGWEVWCRPDREGWLEGERARRERWNWGTFGGLGGNLVK